MKLVRLYCVIMSGILCIGLNAQNSKTYSNPVIATSLPDPTVIKAEDGKYYLYATENIRNVPIYSSSDLVNWIFEGTAFTNQTRPNFEPKGGIWAPDINRIGDKYVMYYSMSVWGGEWTCGIGVASSDSPKGPFTDHGMLFRSNGIGIQNCIDPCYVEENGRHYLFWGSFHGIYGAELSADGLHLVEGVVPKQVAGDAYEGTYIMKRNGYYYLFASVGTCCEGLRSTYRTVVGRSKNLFGPYVDDKNRDMIDNNHVEIIHKNQWFVGTGHNSEIVKDKKGHDWIFYHGFDINHPENKRILLLSRLKWKKGWPYIDGNSPQINGKSPRF